jgi:hypothetical protein
VCPKSLFKKFNPNKILLFPLLAFTKEKNGIFAAISVNIFSIIALKIGLKKTTKKTFRTHAIKKGRNYDCSGKLQSLTFG